MPGFTFEKQVRVIETFLECRNLWDKESPDIYGTIDFLKKAQVFSVKTVSRDMVPTVYNYITLTKALEKLFRER